MHRNYFPMLDLKNTSELKPQRRKSLSYKRKLFFPAGILSLVLLPLFGFRFLFSDPYFHEVHVLEIAYPSPQFIKSFPNLFTSQDASVISIEGNLNERKQKINSIIYQIDSLQKNAGDSSMLQINLEDQSTYGDFIAVINIFKKKKFRGYAVNGNQICVYPNAAYNSIRKSPARKSNPVVKRKVIPVEHAMTCGGVYYTGSPPVIKDSAKENPFQLLAKTSKFRLFIGMFGVLLVANIYLVKKSFLREG